MRLQRGDDGVCVWVVVFELLCLRCLSCCVYSTLSHIFCDSTPGFNTSFTNDWAAREWPQLGGAPAPAAASAHARIDAAAFEKKKNTMFKVMKSLSDEKRTGLCKVYTQTLRAAIQELCVQCTKQHRSSSSSGSGSGSAVERSPPAAHADAVSASETFAIDLRKEIALQELMCAVFDLDEMLPANFMKSHFNALYAPAVIIALFFVTSSADTASLPPTFTHRLQSTGPSRAAAAGACGYFCSTWTTKLFVLTSVMDANMLSSCLERLLLGLTPMCTLLDSRSCGD